MKTDLNPCPFCGGEDTEIAPGICGDWYVGCLPCNYKIRVADCTEEEAIRYWNTRPAEDALKAEVKKLKSLSNELYDLAFVTLKAFEAIMAEHEEDFFNDIVLKCIKIMYKARMEYGIQGVCKKCEDFDCCNCDLQKVFVKVFTNAPATPGKGGDDD